MKAQDVLATLIREISNNPWYVHQTNEAELEVDFYLIVNVIAPCTPEKVL